MDKLEDRVNKYNNNTYNSTIKIKPVDIKSSTCIDFNVEKNDEDPKFKFGDHERVSRFRNTFTKVRLKLVLKIFSH